MNGCGPGDESDFTVIWRKQPDMSGSMWLDLLGLGPLIATVQDPAFAQTVQGMVGTFQDIHQRQVRIEAKLDLLLALGGAHGGRAGITAVPIDNGPVTDRPSAVARRIADDGAGAPVRAYSGNRQ